jgi:hypothetical protein
MSELECSFVAASQRRGRHRAWARRVLVAAVAGSAILAVAGRVTMQARLAETEARAARELAEAKIEAKISSTGKLVAAMYDDDSVTRVWDAGSGKLVAELPGSSSRQLRVSILQSNRLSRDDRGERRARLRQPDVEARAHGPWPGPQLGVRRPRPARHGLRRR